MRGFFCCIILVHQMPKKKQPTDCVAAPQTKTTKHNDAAQTNVSKREKAITKELQKIGDKRWLLRHKKQLEHELAQLRTNGGNEERRSVKRMDKQDGGCTANDKRAANNKRMKCTTQRRCTRAVSASKALEDNEFKLSSYGVFESGDEEEPTTAKGEHCDGAQKESASLEPCSKENPNPVMDLDGEDFCAQCNVPMRLAPNRALMVCIRCGCFSSYIDGTTNSMAYGDEIEISSMYCYKRLNHFRLQLAQLQATETSEVPQHIIDKVLEELNNRGAVKPEDVTIKMIREILKKMKQRKCYDHIPQIYSRVTGIPPVRLTPELEEKLRLMFINIQEPFEKHCPPGRRNFLSYKFLLYKMFQLLGLDELLPFMTLLKGKDKLMKQDAIYRECCKELDWTFIPSL